MKMICIRGECKTFGDALILDIRKGLTEGRVYECYIKPDEFWHPTKLKVKTRNDYGFDTWYYTDDFMSLEEYRNVKLNELGVR